MKKVSIFNSYIKDNQRKREIITEKLKNKGFFPGKNGELLIVVGGDGTFLSAIRRKFRSNPIFVGVNAGNLGFLSEFSMNTIDSMIHTIQKGTFWIEEFPIYEVKIATEEGFIFDYFVNDLVVERKDVGVTAMSIQIEDKTLMTSPADHLIVSTILGSTAYNKDAGGPISFSTDVYQVLFSNSILNKEYREITYPLVVSNKHVLTVFPSVRKQRDYRLVCDGRLHKVKTFDYAEVRKTHYKLRILRSNNYNRVEDIRRKFVLFDQ